VEHAGHALINRHLVLGTEKGVLLFYYYKEHGVKIHVLIIS